MFFFARRIFWGVVFTNGALEIVHKTKSEGFAMTNIKSSHQVEKGKSSNFLDTLFIELKFLLQLPHAVKHHVYMSGPHDEQIGGSRLRS